MNDQLFEMLLSLFEQALSQRCEKALAENSASHEHDDLDAELCPPFLVHKLPSDDSTRVLTATETLKLTKPALQFLYRMMQANVLDVLHFEEIMHAVLESEYVYVTLANLRQIIHEVLLEFLPNRELLMLEFALNLETMPTTMH